MLERWLTQRCLRDDVPVLRTARGGVDKFLRDPGSRSSGTEPLAGAKRADTFTYHFDDGRGARWEDQTREVLWLLNFDDRHDSGYDIATELQDAGSLYPLLDPIFDNGTASAAWGDFPDDDALEWARLIHDSLDHFEEEQAALIAGNASSFLGPSHLTLRYEGDDIWRLTIRRRMAYGHRSDRERWLIPQELRSLVRHVARSENAEDFEWDIPPHPQSFMFADVYFVGGLRTSREWKNWFIESVSTNSDVRPIL